MLVLAALGAFFRSTLGAESRLRTPTSRTPAGSYDRAVARFSGGVSVGANEVTRTVIVLLGRTAKGYGLSAMIGAALGGALLVGIALVVHAELQGEPGAK